MARFTRTLLALVLVSLISFVLVPYQPQAQTTQTEQEATVVTATIPIWDTTPPSKPILISPANTSFLNYNTVTFVWQESIDAFGIDNPEYGMDHYIFYLNGINLFGNLPLESTNTAQYSLVYDMVSGQYSLTPAFNISDGSHTWKVRAVDYFDNYSESVTWTFTVDTQAPHFVLNQIAEKEVSISAQDPTTIPNEPLIIETNRPLLRATGEANSTVQLTVIIPGEPNLSYTTTIDSNGSWELELPLLPRDVVIGMNFIITDQAGNVSVLENVQFLIKTKTIVITPPTFPPITPTPTPTPTPSPSPDPDPDEEDPVVSPTPTPTPPPSITIPVLPPEELAHTVIKEIASRVPVGLVDVVRMIPESVQRPIKESQPYAGLLVSVFIPAIATLAVASQFGGGMSFIILLRILQALGLIPKGDPQGIVYDSDTQEAVPFAVLSVYKVEKTWELVETIVTNIDGIYSGLELPAGTYAITVSHPDYTFPTSKEKPRSVNMIDFYKGEVFEITDEQDQALFLIPMDAIEPEKRKKKQKRVKIHLARLSRFGAKLTIPLFLLSGLFAVLFVSIWNTLVFACYCLLISKHVYAWFKNPIITGIVIDTQSKQPISNAIVRIKKPEESGKVSILRTTENGDFRFFGDRDAYMVTIYHQDFVWIDATQNPMSFYEANTLKEDVHIIATMYPYTNIYEELFR